MKPRTKRAPAPWHRSGKFPDPTRHWPLPSLLTSLTRAGWGDLAGREFQGLRTTLHAIAASLNHVNPHGLVTAPQIAARAGLSERWVRRCLQLLEDLGIITWRRGGIANGKAVPGFISVHRQVLVDLIDAARPLREAADELRRRITAKRVAGIKWAQQNRRSAQPELSSDLPTPYGGVTDSPRVGHHPVAPQAAQAPLSCPHCASQHPVGVACPDSGAPPGGSLRELLRKIKEGELT